jgi:hypothetical protein
VLLEADEGLLEPRVFPLESGLSPTATQTSIAPIVGPLFLRRNEGFMSRFRTLSIACLIACGLVAVLANEAAAQFGGGGGFGFQSVGGISIDAEGIVRNLEPQAIEALAAERRAAIGDGLGGAAELRKVSLAKVVAAVQESIDKAAPIPPEVLFLGGLERVTHVFVDPDRKDVILAGPADRITVDANGTFVGATNRRPLLYLEDFIVALRAIDAARQGGILCSIDPTPEGIAKLQAFLSRQQAFGPAVMRGMEEALGPQNVRVGGVPGTSRFARVLVAADYRMKRIGMGLDESGVDGLPSYLSLVPPGGRASSLPRFWLEAEYDPIARDPDELAWRIDGRRMKCLSENDVAGRNGIQRGAARRDPVAEKWCEAMTTHYNALAAKQPVFAELVNCVDMAVVAALIRGRQLDQRAGLDLGILLDAKQMPMPSYGVPEHIPTVATGLKKGNNWVLSASGGVQFQPWEFVTKTREVPELAASRENAIGTRKPDGWYW